MAKNRVMAITLIVVLGLIFFKPWYSEEKGFCFNWGDARGCTKK